MSVISSRDPGMTAMSTTSATLTRPGSRSSELRPIFLLERCLAIRFERMAQSTAQTTTQTTTTSSKKSESRPGSSLSQLSNWFNFHQPSRQNNNGALPPPPPESCASSDRTIRQQQSVKEQALVKDSSAPAGWVYDGGFVLYQVGTTFGQIEYGSVEIAIS